MEKKSKLESYLRKQLDRKLKYCSEMEKLFSSHVFGDIEFLLKKKKCFKMKNYQKIKMENV